MNFNSENIFAFQSRRSPIYAKNGVVGSSQPLATEIGLSVLKSGGNAADAAVATAAALNVTEPMSTGVGGDCFCLFYDSAKRKVFGLNGSGRSPQKLTLDILREAGIQGEKIPSSSAHAITVPGTVAGWIDTLSNFGTMKIGEVLQPAIRLAEEGFPVSPLTSIMWKLGRSKLKRTKFGNELLLNNKAPKAGQIFRNENLAKIFREIASKGKLGFYKGWVADEIIKVTSDAGSLLSKDDLIHHQSELVNSITTTYRGITIHEIPPNGQGITALLALNLLEHYNLSKMRYDSAEYFHLLIECMRLAFADSRYYVADMEHYDVPISELLSKSYAVSRHHLINREKANINQKHGIPSGHSDTVYLATADSHGNACSFINSNYEAFGTGIVPEGTGFVMQNRGSCFTLIDGHPNMIRPSSRPYHTIIPGMATRNGNLYACFGIMGGFNQPQAQVQALSKLIDFNFDPQTALNSLRFTILGGIASGTVALEEGIINSTIETLRKMGHDISIVGGIGRNLFGNGQIIMQDSDNGIYIAGCDPRCDGTVIGY